MANSVNLSKGLINKIPTNAKLITLKLLKIKVTEFIISQSTKDIDKYSKKFSSLL